MAISQGFTLGFQLAGVAGGGLETVFAPGGCGPGGAGWESGNISLLGCSIDSRRRRLGSLTLAEGLRSPSQDAKN